MLFIVRQNRHTRKATTKGKFAKRSQTPTIVHVNVLIYLTKEKLTTTFVACVDFALCLLIYFSPEAL